MRRRWVRVPPGPADNLRSALAAGVLGAAVGAATFWVVRLFLAREPVGGALEPPREGSTSGSGEGA